MGVIRVVLLCDSSLALDGVTAVLHETDDIRVVAKALAPDEAVETIRATECDVAVVPAPRSPGSLRTMADQLLDARPELRVLVSGPAGDHQGVEEAVQAGCAGFVDQSSRIAVLIDAIRALGDGSAAFPADLLANAARARTDQAHPPLTEREWEVLVRLANAETVAEISEELSLSVHTVRNHVRRTLRKLGARSQLEAVVIGLRLGLITVRDIRPNTMT